MHSPFLILRNSFAVLPSTLTGPALQIHISKASAPEEDPKRAPKAVKLMHRFSPEDVQAKMDLAEKA